MTSNSEEARKVKADIEAKYEEWAEERRKSYSPQWEDDFTGMNARVFVLLDENERLVSEKQALEKEWASVQSEEEKKNQESQSLKDDISHKQNLMDDKKWKEPSAAELNDWKEKSIQMNQELEERKRQLAALDKKIKLGKMKLASLGIDYAPIDRMFKAQEEVQELQAQMAQMDDREKVLNSKIQKMKLSGEKPDPAVAAIKTDIDTLKLKIADAKKNGGRRTASSKEPESTLEELSDKKDGLKAEIARLKGEIDKIQSAQKMGIANQRIKKLVEEMSSMDNQNNDLREEISTLQDNIAVLRSHVKKLEYQAEAINTIKGNLGQTGKL